MKGRSLCRTKGGLYSELSRGHSVELNGGLFHELSGGHSVEVRKCHSYKLRGGHCRTRGRSLSRTKGRSNL